ncbi:MAG: recombinase family protein [Holosporales bacterium]|jgi:DNA invertase Pin-like site-specific DNA recombinase|nr:recombinase family protein [Holosporales bacterium]
MTIRCAIYVRLSDDDKLQKELTSLENQEIYIRELIDSQENCTAIQPVYSDYKYTGDNPNRPALRKLLIDVEHGLIDRILVHKYDRLTRNPSDFFLLRTQLASYNVDIVSVTERFDVTTPDGEFMMHNKIALAQYERAMTRERVKNKQATSKKLGIWTGGNILPGFKSVDRKLELDETLVPLIQHMFKRYVETRSPTTIANEINVKALELSEEEAKNLRKMTRQRVMTLLKNPLYKGYIEHLGQFYKGRHEAIIGEDLWNQVQEILKQIPLKTQAVPTLLEFALKSRVRCKECNRAMLVNLTSKKSRKYAYYTCLNKRNGLPCKGLNVSLNAELLHRLVTAEIRKILKEPELLGGLWAALSEKESPEEGYKKLQNIDKAWDFLSPDEQNKILQDFVKVVHVGKQGLTIEFTPNGQDTSKLVIVKGSFYNRNHSPQVFVHKENPEELNDPELLKTLVQAEIWQREIDDGMYGTCDDIAAQKGLQPEYVRRSLFLPLLSPRIKEAIFFGKLHPQWTLQDFKRKKPSVNWTEQEALYLGEST